MQIGERVGAYEVIAPLGEGGMGQVFRARDAALNRDVAIKVLPDAFAGEPERLARFTREAQTLAALNHSNIAQIFGLEGPDRRVLVMELVEGEDLSAIVARGPVPVIEAIPIARQIAEALEAAHDTGIVHRDLKPANVRLRADGVVKVLDFGLAKAHDAPGSSRTAGDAMQSPTITAHATEMGIVLGTAAYMSPEQARGKPVDKRADIWAFGVVLFEMVTGARAFKGEEVSDILAAVLRQDIDWRALPAGTPPRLRRLLERCLERDPKMRLRDIGEARVELARIESNAADSHATAVPSTAPSSTRSREAIAWAIAAAAIVAAAALVYLRPPGTSPGPSVRLAFVPPAGITFEARGTDSIVVSPDGRMLVFTGRSLDGKRQLYLRALDGADVKRLPGSDEPITPFWSPDSKSVAFGAQGKLKRVDTAGGGAVVVADAPRLNGGTWNRNGVILFVPDYNVGILRVSDQGGAATSATALDATRREVSLQDPFFLPDGQHFLYTANSAERDAATGQVRLGALSTPDTALVVQGRRAWFVSPDRLLFSRDGALFAAPFDPARRQLTGDPVPLGTADEEIPGDSANQFSASNTGVLVLQNFYAPEYQLVWFDRQGQSIGPVHSPTRLRGDPFAPRLSPDGTHVVIQERSSAADRRGIWAIDLGRNLPTRVYAGAGQYPQWSPDGRSIAWTMPYEGVAGIYAKAASGAGAPELVVKAGVAAGGNAFANDWSRDGRFILYHTRGEKTRVDVWALPLFGDRMPHPVLNSEFDDGPAQLSPDGRWLAYRSDASGSYEIYVQSFTADGRAGGDPARISTNGGHQPRFRPDGKELFYLANDNRLMAVTMGTRGATLEPGEPKALFKTRTMPRGEQVTFEYDVARDGQRFLMGTVLEGPYALPPPPTIVLNWTSGLTK